MPLTDTVLMIRPSGFKYNQETAKSNFFQKQNTPLSSSDIQNKVLAEFDASVSLLKQQGVQILAIDDTPFPVKPDAVFPNN